jgi:hypothetical protein
MRKIIIICSILILAGIVLALTLHSRQATRQEKVQLAQCLSRNGFAMAGTSWCPHCQKQKELFGDAFQYITFHDCDAEQAWCESRNITGYPAWVGPHSVVTLGFKDIATLRRMSGCMRTW